ncbi:MAG: hypothetical protein PVJ67_02030 [Candidatus Pacearchaeota archaeon]|jgi:hypothetical protein
MAEVIPMKKKEELTERDIAKKTLESKFWQNIYGANSYELGVKNGEIAGDPGLTGAYDAVLGSEEASKLREQTYVARKKAYEEAGIAGEPAMPSNADVVYGGMGDIRNSLQLVGLEDLYEIMTKIDPTIKKYSLPEKGLELSLADIYVKAEKDGALVREEGKEPKLDFEKLSPEYQEALISLNELQTRYQESCQESLRRERKESTLEALSRQRHEQFHPKEEKQAA